MAEGVRIQKVLADAGLASRRGADAMVAAGRVTVNGSPAQVGQRVDPSEDTIAVDGRPLAGRSRPVYLALAKPAGVTSTVSDRHAERTVISILPDDLRRAAGRIYPVGRLDRDSEGLLLLTNDGSWAQHLLHPRYEVEREYAIGLAEPLSVDAARRLEAGIRLDEGTARLTGLRAATATEVSRLESLMGRSQARLVWYRAVLTQGWRRQLRRMFTEVGLPVQRLVRVRIGTLRLDGLHTGEVRSLSRDERDRLESMARRAGLVVSLDGPGSSGKSSVGAGAAVELGYRFCDTGVLYRALTWLAVERGVDPEDGAALVGLIPELQLAPDEVGRLRHVVVGGDDVTDRLHSSDVDQRVSLVARQPDVRAALLPLQRGLAREGRIIMAGRDIGSVVLPDADLKLYIEVSADERARRRAKERGVDIDSPEGTRILADLRRRDELDSTRATAPLRVPDGASIIRSDGLRLDQTVAKVVGVIREAEMREGTGR